MKRKPSTPQKKVDYESPSLTVTVLQMEQGIAAGSAAVVSSNTTGEVLEEWEIGADREGDIPW
ncbi:hypothetical protein OKW96_06055 [Sphingobacterium sp. KU25419]|nr:hypothetical protein OKW96_06055 [Sphingobacterium sp. KU25419]